VVALTPRQWFWSALAATLVFRFWLAAALPVTADEAYFALWGRHPDIGFYDHPPMVGWLLAPLMALSEAGWWVRLPSVLLPAALAFLVRHALVRDFGRDAGTADLAALAVLLVPVNVWNVLITTDTPLVFFSVLSMLAFARQRFFLAGLLVWTAILDPARRGVPTPGRRAAFAGVVLLAGFPLGDLLVATGPLYDHYAQLADRPFGLSAAEDQTRAGLLMMAEQIATLGAAAALLLWSHAERAAAATAGFHAPNQGRPG